MLLGSNHQKKRYSIVPFFPTNKNRGLAAAQQATDGAEIPMAERTFQREVFVPAVLATGACLERFFLVLHIMASEP